MYPWENSDVWKNEKAFFVWLRGQMRRIWTRHPAKIEALKAVRKQIPNPNPKGRKPFVWGCKCAQCGKMYAQSQVQVDHIAPAGSLLELRDIQSFVERLLVVSPQELRVLCKPCHQVITNAHNKGLSFDESREDLKLVAFRKLAAAKQKAKLKKMGASEDDLRNGASREGFFKKTLK